MTLESLQVIPSRPDLHSLDNVEVRQALNKHWTTIGQAMDKQWTSNGQAWENDGIKIGEVWGRYSFRSL